MNRRQLLRAILAAPGFAIVPVEPAGQWLVAQWNTETGDLLMRHSGTGETRFGVPAPESWYCAERGLVLGRRQKQNADHPRG